MKNPKINLVAGRLSKIAGPGQSAYAKNRLGITVEGQTPQGEQLPMPEVESSPAAPAADGASQAKAAIRESAKPVPSADAGSPSAGLDIIRQLEMMLAPAPEVSTPPVPADLPLPAPAVKKPLVSWEMPSAPTAPVSFADVQRTPTATPDKPKPKPKLEASAIWNDSSPVSSPSDRVPQPKSWVHFAKLASPALGGLVLIAVIWGVWTWINSDSTTPRHASASLTPQSYRPSGTTTRPDLRGSDNRSANQASVKPPTALAGEQYPYEYPRAWQWAETDDLHVLPLPEAPWAPTAQAVVSVEPVAEQPTPPAHHSETTFRDPPPGLQLTSIVKLSRGAAANINGRFLHVGDTIDDAKLISIGKFTVEMELKGERFILGFGDATQSTPPDTPTSQPAK